MDYHILNGEALLDRLKSTQLEGEIIIMRECLIVGDLSGDTLEDFYTTRSNYLSTIDRISPEHYFLTSVKEFDKISSATGPTTFHLWFGYDLFCQTNLWFILSLIRDLKIDPKVYLIYPYHLTPEDRWLDFGKATIADLRFCFSQRKQLHSADIDLGHQLWKAYKDTKLEQLQALAVLTESLNPYSQEVIKAHLDRFQKSGVMGRPQRKIKEILAAGISDFPTVFYEFSKTEGVYGFGDVQVKSLFDLV